MAAALMQNRPSEKDHYQVKFEDDDHGVFYGIANTSSFDERVQREAQHGRIVVEHAEIPKSVSIPEERLIDIPLNCGVHYHEETGRQWGGDEYHQYVALQSLLHEIRHERLLPDNLLPRVAGCSDSAHISTPRRRPHTGSGAFLSFRGSLESRSPHPRREDARHMMALIAGLVLALLLAVVALVREVRLRRALQELLRRLLTHWRHRFGKDDTTDDQTAPDADPDRRL